MSEDRTQPPSKRRRQLAREQGQVAHSPELTAAAGWLAALIAWGIAGNDLTSAMVGLLRSSMAGAAVMPADPAGVAGRVRGLVLGLGWPLGIILASFAAGALAAHQLQVRGLWSAGLIAPDPARLWTPGRGPSLAERSGRLAWAAVKALLLVAISAWVLHSAWGDVLRLSELEGPGLARAASRGMLPLAALLAGMLLVLGLVDYGLRYVRFEARLRTTVQEQREDQRAMEGDLPARAHRRRIARSWRGDAPELLAGASLVLHGPGGLTVVLAGGPPPRRVAIRAVAKGNTGLSLRRSSEAIRVPRVEAAELARRLAHRVVPGSPIAAERIAELAAIWPPR
jgi:flagellar biosynthesis protein FlhB